MKTTELKRLTPLQKKTKGRFTNRFSFWMFKITSLPLAWVAGIRVDSLDEQHCTCSVPFKHLTKNPFKSVYFAAQTMTAELSTGALVVLATQVKGKSFSTLVTGTSATFHKKATGRVYFTCEDGQRVLETVEQSLATNEPVELVCSTIGKLKDGTVVSKMTFTWSVKARA